MNTGRRVAITGIGVVCCFGRGRSALEEAVCSGRIGIRRIESIDSSVLHCRIAGEVPRDALSDDAKGRDRFTRLALIAAGEAVEQSGLQGSIAPERVATIIGTGLGGSETLDAGYDRLYRRGQTRIPPMVIPQSMYNAASSAISERFQSLGPSFAVVSACSSSTHAIGQAALWIAQGLADAAITGGADAPIVHGVIRGWEALRVLSMDNDNPDRACRPFSVDRAGMVLAEGSAVFVLEEYDRAVRRGCPILGEIAGVGMSSDGGHVTDPSPDGAGRAIRGALESSGLQPDQIDYINAHGTATRANDSTETAAIRHVFGEAADRVPVSSTKSMHGHAMGASGAIELAASLLALNSGTIPPTMNFTPGDPGCDLDYVPNQPRRSIVRNLLSNSFGFGGMNGVLAVRTIHGLP